MATPTLGAVRDDYIQRLDPEYVAFHNKHFADLPVLHKLPWDPAFRTRPAAPGNTPPQPVGNTKDLSLSKSQIRAFIPGVLTYVRMARFVVYARGGWTLGTINSENSFCTHMCNGANCVVISLDYRLAPEHPYPAAVEDTIEALQWIHEQGPRELNIDVQKVAVGGSSSGGNLAAIAALKAAETNFPIAFQLLIVPVTDNCATAENNKSWKENENTPWLDVGRMNWFKTNYLPNPMDWAKWDASPIYAPDALIAKQPPAFIACMECDILRDEAIAYGDRLQQGGVKVHTEMYKGAPHQIMVMDDALAISRKLIADCVQELRNAFSA